MKCSLLIQQLIYPSYDYFKHKTKNNETRCNCFLEDFLYLLFFTFNWNECFLSTHIKPLGFAISLLCFVLCFLRNWKETALNINEFHLKLRWRQADANNKYCHFLCVLAVVETTINTKFKSTALYKSKKCLQIVKASIEWWMKIEVKERPPPPPSPASSTKAMWEISAIALFFLVLQTHNSQSKSFFVGERKTLITKGICIIRFPVYFTTRRTPKTCKI